MQIHVVTSVETLFSIARRYALAPGLLARYNGLTEPYRLAVGQSLLVLRPQSIHTVRPGDSLWNIARRYDVSVDDLKRWNNVDENALRVGATMIVEAQ